MEDQNIAFIPPPIDPNEDLTRKMYIDTLMREAGWDPYATNVPEYPVKNCMPQGNGSGDGNVDYVLWGDDGKPVAVIEAKRTSRDPRVGQHQAKCYADCIEREEAPIEKIMTFIRRSLVLPMTPITYYARGTGRTDLLTKLYEKLSGYLTRLHLYELFR
ncbi:MAG: hypothetical protein K9I82_10540 [Chitinophagaceae bacterium]|nr:hypothetical protein [Chitinophagaceae bacterium]